MRVRLIENVPQSREYRNAVTLTGRAFWQRTIYNLDVTAILTLSRPLNPPILGDFELQKASIFGWTVPEDNPARYWGDYMRAVCCSHRDLVGFVRAALGVERDFLAAVAVSANQRGIFDLEKTTALLGFTPQDDTEAYGR